MVNLQIGFPDFSGELLVNMFIPKKEEGVLGIDQNTTESIERITKSLIVMGLQ